MLIKKKNVTAKPNKPPM